MDKPSQIIQLDTRLGPLRIEANLTAGQISSDSLSLESAEFQPKLPKGMSVERCRAVLVRLIHPNAQFRLQLRAALSSEAVGKPCTGQCLEAMEWDSQGSLLIIGTEDADALHHRMPRLGVTLDLIVAEYTPRGIELRLSGTTRDVPSTFHLIIAENPSPEPVPDSAWFAVDVPHQSLKQTF